MTRLSAGYLSEKLLILAFALTFYCLGTTYFEAFVNYRTWSLIGAREFRACHQALSALVVKVMLLPIVGYFLSLVGLLLLRPATVPRRALALSLALLLVAIVSGVLIQIPIQAEFDSKGLSLTLVQRLITSDLIFRKIPLGLNGLLWLGIFSRQRVDSTSVRCP